jgi:hypothetical protein
VAGPRPALRHEQRSAIRGETQRDIAERDPWDGVWFGTVDGIEQITIGIARVRGDESTVRRDGGRGGNG